MAKKAMINKQQRTPKYSTLSLIHISIKCKFVAKEEQGGEQ